MSGGASAEPLLEVAELSLAFGRFKAIDRLSYGLYCGETLGVVGESGCGKTVAALALVGLLPAGARCTGSVRFAGEELLGADEQVLRGIRGRRIAMIFQEPLTALNPVLSVGEQVAEMFILHQKASRRDAREQAIDALARVNIPDPGRRATDYPHQLSGGMRQRVMIAMALACRPELLIADEPTTALDVTVQAQILDLILGLQEELAMAVLFISHNLGVISQVADRVMVMYAGRAVEVAAADIILREPRHPYTRALLETLPQLGAQRGPLPAIPGTVPPPDARPEGCVFAPRCALAEAACRVQEPALETCGEQHAVACIKMKGGGQSGSI